ncbi:MAG TPA: hypothetical protein VF137_00070 [Candidatus Dormibacteraeota bacterium]
MRVDPPARRAVIAALATVTLLIVAFWVIWFFGDRSLVATEARPAYFEHEESFVLADSWLALCTAAGAVTLTRRSPLALFWVLAGGGAGLYLGSMDALYDLRRNDWFGAGPSGYVEMAIVVITWALSLTLLTWAWRSRASLLGHAVSYDRGHGND